MKKSSIALTLLTSVLVPASLFAAEIGVVGAIESDHQEGSRADINLDTLRATVSEEVSDGIDFNADININDTIDVEEAYVNIDEIFSTVGISNFELENLDVAVGKKRLNVGRSNTQQIEDFNGVNRAFSAQSILGSNGLAGNGAELNYEITATPLPIDVSVGYFKSLDTLNDNSSADLGDPSYQTGADAVTFKIGSESEDLGLDLAFSGLISGDGSEDADDAAGSKVTVYAVDGGYTRDLMSGSIDVEAELLTATYEQVNDEEISRTGFNVYAGYNWNDEWTTGVRFDSVSGVDADKISGETLDSDAKSEVALIVKRNISETTQLRLQYAITGGWDDYKDDNDLSKNDDSYLTAQIVFGL